MAQAYAIACFEQLAITEWPAIGVQCWHERSRGCVCSRCHLPDGPMPLARTLDSALCGACTVVPHDVWNRSSSDSARGSALRNPTQLNGGIHSCRCSLLFQPQPQ